MQDTLKTYKQAYKVLLSNGATTVEMGMDARCECGYCTQLKGYDDDWNLTGTVLVCDSCGDDDAFVDEVLTTKTESK